MTLRSMTDACVAGPGACGGGASAAGCGASRGAGSAASSQRRQRGLQRDERVGLGEEAVHAGVAAALLVVLLGVGGQRDDGHPRRALVEQAADGGRGLVAVHDRHLAVHQHQVEAAAGGDLDRLRAVVGDLPPQAQLVEHRLGDALVDRVVLDQQDAAGQAARQALLRRRRRLVGDRPREDAPERAVQRGASHRLVDVRQLGGLQAPALVGLVGRREQQQPRPGQRRLRADAAHEFRRIHARQALVDQHQVVGEVGTRRLAQRAQRLRPVLDAAREHAPALELFAQRVAHGPVIVDDEHARALEPVGGQGRREAGPRRRQPQVEGEPRPPPRFALDADAPAHQPEQAPADRQPQPGAAVAPAHRAVGLREVLEHLLEGVRSDADAGVLDPDADQGLVVGPLQQPDAHHDLAALGELDRVAQQVGQHLPQAERVAAQAQRCVGRDDLHRQLDPLGLRRLREHRQRLLDHVDEAEVDRAPAPGARTRSWRSRGCR